MISHKQIWPIVMHDAAKKYLPYYEMNCLWAFLTGADFMFGKLGIARARSIILPVKFERWIETKLTVNYNWDSIQRVSYFYGNGHRGIEMFFQLLGEYTNECPFTEDLCVPRSKKGARIESFFDAKLLPALKLRPLLYLRKASICSLYSWFYGEQFAFRYVGRPAKLPSWILKREKKLRRKLSLDPKWDFCTQLLALSDFDEQRAFDLLVDDPIFSAP